MKIALAMAMLVPVFASPGGGPAMDSGKVEMPKPASLDSAPAWKKFLAIDEGIGKEKSLARLDAMAKEAEALETALGRLLNEDLLASMLTDFLSTRIQSRKKALQPKPGRRPKPDLWKEAAGAYEHARVRFRIIEGFHAKGIQAAYVDGLEAEMPKGLERLSLALEKAEAASPEPASFSGPVPKDGKVTKKSEDIRAFISLANDSLAAWKGKADFLTSIPSVPSQSQLDSSLAWKGFKALHDEIPKITGLSKIPALEAKRDKLDPLIHELFPQNRLASDLMSLISNRINNHREMLQPTRGRSPRPDYWNETMNSYRGTQRRFRIILAFKELKLMDSLISEFESKLPESIASISASLEKAEKNPREKDGFPGEITSKSQPKVTRSDRVQEINAFLNAVKDSVTAWSVRK